MHKHRFVLQQKENRFFDNLWTRPVEFFMPSLLERVMARIAKLQMSEGTHSKMYMYLYVKMYLCCTGKNTQSKNCSLYTLATMYLSNCYYLMQPFFILCACRYSGCAYRYSGSKVNPINVRLIIYSWVVMIGILGT